MTLNNRPEQTKRLQLKIILFVVTDDSAVPNCQCNLLYLMFSYWRNYYNLHYYKGLCKKYAARKSAMV